MSDRHILHCDCNSFFASVEETFSPELKLVPMAIAGDPESRHGIILAKNELAKKYKIQTAETVWSAKRKCPELVLRPPRRGAYSEFSERINAIYEQYTPFVERFGVDESFLDVTGCLLRFDDNPVALAEELRVRVAREIGVTISIGVSWNKIFAKLGSDYKKPNAVTVITRDNYREIVYPLPASDLFFVGRKTADALNKLGIRTIGELAGADESLLSWRFGKMGDVLHMNANGLDNSPVARTGETSPVKSVGNGFTFRRDLVSEDDIRVAVRSLSDSVASRLRRADMKCKTIQVAIRDNALKSITRQETLTSPTFISSEIAVAALNIIHAHWKIGNPIRTLTITGENLTPADGSGTEQLTLFDAPEKSNRERLEKLERAMDSIRGKLGKDAVKFGSVVGNDLGIGKIERNDENEDE
jgi:DNA polymerase-4